jgi:PAS domain S-box-containing protein
VTLRRKIAIIIGAAICGLILVVYLLVRLVLLDSFAHLEQDDMRRNLERATNALEAQLNHLTATTTDWAYWDDTYAFIQDHNAAYIEANLADETMAYLDLSLVLYVDNAGQTVFSKAFDQTSGQEVPLPAGLSGHLSPDCLLSLNGDASSVRRGLIVLPDGPMLVVARPILTSASQGPARGTLIFGSALDEAQIARLAESTRLSLAAYVWGDPRLTADFRAARAALSEQSPTMVRPRNDNTLAGYALLTDIYGHPALILRVDLSRQIYAQGQTTLTYFMAVMVGLGLLVGVVLLALLEKTVLAEAQMGVMFEHSSDAIILTRPDGTIRRVNPAFRHVFDGLSDRLAGQPLPALFEGQLTQPLEEALRAVVEQGENRTIDVAVRDRSGDRVDMDMALSPIRTPHGRASGVFCSLRDITAHRRLEEQLRKNLAQEAELNELKTRLISTVSHELRNPLAAIQMADEILTHYADRMTDEQRQERMAQIRSGIRRMNDLLENLLTFSRAEAGKLKLEPTRFDLVAFCQDVVDSINMFAGRTHTFVFSSQGGCSVVCMDQRLVQLITSNLLSNAVKYSPGGSTIKLELRCEGGRSVVQVRDAGIGIPPEDRAGLFEPFFRAHNVGTVTGVGLGLAIVKQAVEAHGGTITCESQVGTGTTFTVMLPNLASAAGTRPAEEGSLSA